MHSRTHSAIYVGAEWHESETTLDVMDPAAGEAAASVFVADMAHASVALDTAAGAGQRFRRSSPRDRSDVLLRASHLMRDREVDLANTISLETGKTRTDALGEVRYAAGFLRWFSEEAVRVGGEMRISPEGDKWITTMVQPIGVCLLITPWNLPLAMIARKVGPAIAAGCTSIIKPASATPLSAIAMVSILLEAGLDSEAVNLVAAPGSSGVVESMIEDGRVRKVSFTGSTEVGRRLLEVCSSNVVRTSMELGGNAPFIVLDDADLDDAVSGALAAKLRHSGQACTAANRFLVHESMVGPFTERLESAMSGARLGGPDDPSAEIGPMIDRAAQQRLTTLVDSAVSDGAQLRSGGTPPDREGFFFPGTVLADVGHGASVLEDEIFGPVAPVSTFESDDDAIALANATQHGLIAYLFGGDQRRALRMVEELEAGMVAWNRGVVSDPAAPFGGVKQSGIGREGGRQGIEDYVEVKYLAMNR